MYLNKNKCDAANNNLKRLALKIFLNEFKSL